MAELRAFNTNAEGLSEAELIVHAALEPAPDQQQQEQDQQLWNIQRMAELRTINNNADLLEAELAVHAGLAPTPNQEDLAYRPDLIVFHWDNQELAITADENLQEPGREGEEEQDRPVEVVGLEQEEEHQQEVDVSSAEVSTFPLPPRLSSAESNNGNGRSYRRVRILGRLVGIEKPRRPLSSAILRRFNFLRENNQLKIILKEIFSHNEVVVKILEECPLTSDRFFNSNLANLIDV
jgi:hypothetical protein